MKKHFVRTSNDQRFRTALQQRESRGAREANLIVVHGRAGDGKTRTLHNWASTPNALGAQAVMLTADPSWTPHRMMLLLAERLGVVPRGDWQSTVGEHIADGEVPLVIDEAGFALTNNAACLERLRSITDKSGTALVLVVMERDMARLRQHDQITSRATLCPFHPATVADVRAACSALAEVGIADELAERIHRESTGRMRQVLEAINVVEQVGQAANKTQLGSTDLGDYALCADFATPVAKRRRGAA